MDNITLLTELRAIQELVEKLILQTPTGETRELTTEINIKLLMLLDKITK